ADRWLYGAVARRYHWRDQRHILGPARTSTAAAAVGRKRGHPRLAANLEDQRSYRRVGDGAPERRHPLELRVAHRGESHDARYRRWRGDGDPLAGTDQSRGARDPAAPTPCSETAHGRADRCER